MRGVAYHFAGIFLENVVVVMSEEHSKGLTPRETEVLKLIAEGNSSKQITARLGISFKTVVSHRSRIMGKLGIHEVASLVRYAVREKLIEP